ncbi:hypothetical protein [Algibacter sp. PT7-4]
MKKNKLIFKLSETQNGCLSEDIEKIIKKERFEKTERSKTTGIKRD